ncbi:alcohol dehydrogenase catalytic domain-containing protein [Streptomyces millisiae]|uniref:Alcohol dehydrogenase catalytic domain-containing protein n=1 Tax=Streptomyces millisiae TaxID=3075542 RepID=A0ABU2LJA3_9ACTN|nr:alcohol dehydrogenase catalytic domain-containing protein [Streptomyces sp. DSM 44918]MDT0317664.1 alcohol dehydrogenase catalytic domain-containing protein [Streptomyces sp. DSM 44918]
MRVELGPHGPLPLTTPPPRPAGEHAVLVRVELAGVCRSDLKEIVGNRHGVSQFGHEIVGTVEESTLPELPPGRRVGLDPNVPVARSTGFATRLWAAGPATALRDALPTLPSDAPARRLVFGEPLACAHHCLTAAARHRHRDLAGTRLTVLGAGTAGVLIAALAQTRGATVTLANRSADRLDFLRRRDAVTFPLHPPSELPADTADITVVATSFVHADVLTEALRLTTAGGLVLLYGGTAPGDTLPGLDVDLDTVRRHELATATRWGTKPLHVGGSYGTTPADFPAAVRALTDSPELRVERLVTHETTLAQLPALLREQAAGRPLGKTLVTP